MYHHPVHKISFIAQDVADNRAFGYIYGSPENGHRFFGIKTEKAAGQVNINMYYLSYSVMANIFGCNIVIDCHTSNLSIQVVVAMRDLFQVVFELKSN